MWRIITAMMLIAAAISASEEMVFWPSLLFAGIAMAIDEFRKVFNINYRF